MSTLLLEYTVNQFIANRLATKDTTRRVTHQGREYIVAPLTLIVPGVLNGSKGALYYPPDEVGKNPSAWDGMPLTLGHPTVNGGGVSAKEPGALDRHGLGFVNRSRVSNGRLVAEGWFDMQRTGQLAPAVLRKLEQGEPIELSTGLFTKNQQAYPGATHNGRQYTHIARDYRPDHVAVLHDQVGACSLQDGCGVNNNAVANCGCGGKCGCGDTDTIDTPAMRFADPVHNAARSGRCRELAGVVYDVEDYTEEECGGDVIANVNDLLAVPRLVFDNPLDSPVSNTRWYGVTVNGASDDNEDVLPTPHLTFANPLDLPREVANTDADDTDDEPTGDGADDSDVLDTPYMDFISPLANL